MCVDFVTANPERRIQVCSLSGSKRGQFRPRVTPGWQASWNA